MFFLLLFILLSPTFAQTPDTKVLSQDIKWQRLLHYKPRWFGGVKSEADGKHFFLSDNGKYDPEGELKKSIELFSSTNKPDDNHAICRFPLRFKWLNGKLGMPWHVDISGCTTYISFFQKLAAKRASIIFSSYYLSNPNSAFGHTLLRLSRFDDAKETELLDYGINFAAESKGSNPFTYAFKGLFGGFEGRFNAIPYYYKIREYSNGEFRDLWSYELNLTQPQVFELVDHIWELGHTYFDYWYFDENCSYHLLALLEVIFPEKDLTSHFRFFAIPADTIRELRLQGMISEGKRRESTYSKLLRLSDGLSTSNLVMAKDLALDPKKTEILSGTDDQKAADILDVSIEAFDYYNSKKILTDDPKTKEKKRPLLEARAKNPVITKDDEAKVDMKDSPALTHSPVRLGLYQGYQDGYGQVTRFEFRATFHDLLDPVVGSLKNGELEMGRFSFEHIQRDYHNGGDFRFDQFSILSAKNLADQNFWASPMSWELGVGAKQIFFTCFDCPGAYLDGSVGNTVQFHNGQYLVSFLLNGELDIHNAFQENYRVGAGPKLYMRARITDYFLSGLSLPYHWYSYSARDLGVNQAFLPDWETRYHLKNNLSFALKLRAQVVHYEWTTRGELGLQYFY
ncbi:MAG: DUF4105 domain-containing protein [Bacteriovoracaceae bacterium]